MNYTIFDTISFVSSYISIIPSLLFLIFYKRLTHVQKLIGTLIITTFLVEIASRYLWYKEINNLFLFHVYAPLAFVIMNLIYKRVLKELVKEHWFNILITIFLMFAFLNSLFIQKISEFNSNVTTSSSLIYIIFSLIYFYKLLKEIKYDSLERNPIFWFNSGVLIYYSSTLFLFLFGNELIPEEWKIAGMVWGLNSVFNIILNIFYIVTIWTKPVKQHS